MKTIDIIANEYHDKINNNSYFNCGITINKGSDQEEHIHLPFQYGYGEQYIHVAMEHLKKLGIIDSNTLLSIYCRENNIELTTTKNVGCSESKLKKMDKKINLKN